jgi:uncharacterized protein
VNHEFLRFAAEKPLGKLSKWLRLLGFDTAYESDKTAHDFALWREEKRVLLTRTTRRKHLVTEAENFLFIRSDRPFDQLRGIIRELKIPISALAPFSRCADCNLPLFPVSREAVRGRVPDYTFLTRESFSLCRMCDRVFWRGSHFREGRSRIARLFAMEEGSGIRREFSRTNGGK